MLEPHPTPQSPTPPAASPPGGQLHRRGRDRFWRDLQLYLEFWAIAREPA